jgi:Protein of unknown function (DUF3703)
MSAIPSRHELVNGLLREARSLEQDGNPAAAFARLERAHLLGQPRTVLHVRSHVAMLGWAWRRRTPREITGQLLRIAAAALFTWLWVPRGNTGGANIPALRQLPLPADLEAQLRQLQEQEK